MTFASTLVSSDTHRFEFPIRPFRWDDLPIIAAIANRQYAAQGSDDHVTETEIREYYTSPEITPESDVIVVTDPTDRVIAFAEIEMGYDSHRCWSEIGIEPAFWGRGIGSHLIQTTEAMLRARLSSRFGEDSAVGLERHCNHNAAPVRAFFEQHGYRHIRSFYRMMIDLDAVDPAIPVMLPDGFAFRPVTPEQFPMIYAAQQEAFRDHWGSETYPYEEWLHWFVNHANARVDLWRIVWSGDHIAALSTNRVYSDDQPDLGWVSQLATRRPYRKQGLASALLHESFRAFKTAGFARVGLGVDASSLTGAVGVYERAGMHIVRQTDAFAKMLRGDWLPIYDQDD